MRSIPFLWFYLHSPSLSHSRKEMHPLLNSLNAPHKNVGRTPAPPSWLQSKDGFKSEERESEEHQDEKQKPAQKEVSRTVDCARKH